MNNSAKTAMKRLAPSAPMKWLASNERIVGDALDYGCGHGYDAREYCMKKYDLNHHPVMPPGMFDTITCNYVLNVIESDDERMLVLRTIRNKLRKGGKAYITVRNDKRALNGTTSKDTWQGHVILRLPVVRSCAGYVTYLLRDDQELDRSVMEVWTYG